MATAAINGNVVAVSIATATPALRLDMSLQRHSYRYCAGAATAGEINSLLYAGVDDATITAEAVEVGDAIETLLKKASGSWEALFGKTITVRSGRTYLVDNSGLVPGAAPNHFFVTGGKEVWAKVSQDDYIAARDVRRVEEAIATRRERGDTYDYLDPKKLYAKSRETGGAGNPVVAAVAAARVSIAAASADIDAALIAASGRKDIVALIRS
ncbi:hypothetical protein [Streptacidiphilus melanogenes]|uniref:hypothetical protein n=1 Tax=Streptacidiphilus melanogenes TaxID=411235 RepID=UPI0005AA7FBD|nr:hypothetical protein [Streptacidiphilus melanogenes]